MRPLEAKGLTPEAYLLQPQAARVVAVGEAVRTLRVEGMRIKDGAKTVPLDRYYTPEYVSDLLRGALTRAEVDRLVFGKK